MRLPDAGFASMASAGAIAATVRPAAQGGNFSRLWSEVNAEVRHFIEHGGSGAGEAVSVEGAWRRWQLEQSTAMPASVAPVSAEDQDRFLTEVGTQAAEAARQLGVSPELVLAHAALESGWGKRPLRNADGSDSHNLFGIKADASWRGAALQAMTTEHENGVDEHRQERFRSYPDMGAAMNDYARLLRSNPRYQAALNTGGDAVAFAQGLARGGYATDPDYARKLVQVARQLQSRD